MSAPVGASLLKVRQCLKGWKGNGDLGLSLCSCCLAACGESSMKSICRTDNHEVGENCGIVDEAQSECTTREDSTFAQFPFSNGTRSSPSSGWRGIDTVISQISRDSSRNNGGVVEQVGNRKGLGKLRSSQYKGVLAQRNGRWGAQIYEKHRRVWLGTFNTEEDAAQSYDTAALKFRGRKAITNFNPIEDTHPEATFLRCHSKAEIVDMLRTHTYREELHDSYKMNGAESNGSSNHDGSKVTGGKPIEGESAAYPRVHLFEKALTPSDVGKLNRLVIPKLHAQRWLPLELASRDKGVTLNCQDATGKLWRFRYSYWNSSQSFVLTKGWCRYTKGKRLQAGDTVIFEHSTGDLRQLYISFRRRPCNIFKQKADFCTLPVHPMLATPLPVCSQSTDEFHSQPPIQDRSIISKGLIPSLSPTNSSSAFDIYSLHSSIKSASEKRNSWPLEYAHPRSKELSSSVSPNSSSVTVFGVNLSLDVCTVLPH